MPVSKPFHVFSSLLPSPFSPHPSIRILTLAALLILAAGCNRAFYRRQADCEVYSLVDSANFQTSTPLADYSIEPDCESRFFDPNCPDLPPMPPDDPVSHRLMHCVDCKPGWPCWDCYGKTSCVENPGWRDYLPLDEQGVAVLDRREAVRLALIHSRQYQKEQEDLYLSALAVTFQRFRLDAQFFGGNDTFFTTDGRLRGGAEGESSSKLETDTGLQMKKLLATGGELAVGMANSLVWQFAGPDTYSATTLLDFSLVQPLLRAGGRAIVLEELTDSERTLLANIRQMERFRRSFYAQIISGRSPGTGLDPNRVLLSELSLPSTGITGGILRLLEEKIRIGNQRANVAGLGDSLEQLEAAYEAGRIDRFQVDLARQALFDAQSRLLQLRADYDNRLDDYKITLGLPPNLEVKIEDSLLKRFELIDPRVNSAREAVVELLDQLRDPEQVLSPAEYLPTVASIVANGEEVLAMLRNDMESLREALPARRASLQRLATREEIARGDVDPDAVNVPPLERRAELLEREWTRLSGQLETMLAELKEAERAGAEPSLPRVIARLVRLSDLHMELSLVQAEARLDTVTLIPIELDGREALRIARRNRRDWRNARAGLVDQWRQIEVAADDLQSDLDVVFSGDINTTDNNPMQFRGTAGRLRVGLEFDAPLARLEERNTYRSTLIAYQRARRDFYAFEDAVSQTLRDILRTIRLTQLDFELQREAVRVAISQVDLTQLRLQRPPQPGEESKFSDNTARDLVSALSGLLRAQNDFVSQWVTYEVQRLNLDLDLGTMALDAEGQWIDPGPIVSDDTSGQSDMGEEADVEELPLPEGIPLPMLLELP